MASNFHALRLSPRQDDPTVDLQTRAVAISRIYGAGSVEYSKFLDEVNSTLLGATLELPKFVPGDVKNGAASKHRKKKRTTKKKIPAAALTALSQHHQRLLREASMPECMAQAVPQAPSSNSSSAQDATRPSLAKVEEEEEERRTWGKESEPWRISDSRTVQRSQTEKLRTEHTPLRETSAALRRSQSSLDAEQTTMDEQVALQLQTLVREKAELIKENSRLKNENEGLKTLLEYATCEATADDDGEDSDYEASGKEVLRHHPGIQAWHPPELQSPTSFSSYGMLGSTSSSEEKEAHVHSHASEEAYQLRHP